MFVMLQGFATTKATGTFKSSHHFKVNHGGEGALYNPHAVKQTDPRSIHKTARFLRVFRATGQGLKNVWFASSDCHIILH